MLVADLLNTQMTFGLLEIIYAESEMYAPYTVEISEGVGETPELPEILICVRYMGVELSAGIVNADEKAAVGMVPDIVSVEFATGVAVF